MPTFTLWLVFLLWIQLTYQPSYAACRGSAEYTITVNVRWSNATDKNFVPGTTVVGNTAVVVHNKLFKLWAMKVSLSGEVREFVQFDNTTALNKTLTRLVKDNVLSEFYFVTPDASGTLPAGVRSKIRLQPKRVDGQHTYVSFLTVLNGTPDYFFGPSEPLNLCDDTKFRDSVLVQNVTAFDAGFDAREALKDGKQQWVERTGVRLDKRKSLIAAYGDFNVVKKQTARRRDCFPGDATVLLENGVVRKMHELNVGDRVAVGNNGYAEVFMFTHKLPEEMAEFVQLTTESGNMVQLTDGHYLRVNGEYMPADQVRIGDRVVLEDGSFSLIESIDRVISKGLFNPQTTHGDVVVNGVLATTFTTAIERSVAHALLAPFRAVYERFGISTSLLYNGADVIGRSINKNH